MGVRTGFFVASREALEAAAPGWIRPKYGAYTRREVTNPFTLETVRIAQHELLSEASGDCPPDSLLSLMSEGEFGWKMGTEDLEALMAQLTGADEASTAELGRRALLGPEDAESWVFECPAVFVAALAALDRAALPGVAESWRKKMHWPEAPADLLGRLRETAARAVAADQPMFVYVAL